MLILARAEQERFIMRIDGRKIATVTFVRMHQHKARIGVDSPPEVEILREELDREQYPDDYRPARKPA